MVAIRRVLEPQETGAAKERMSKGGRGGQCPHLVETGKVRDKYEVPSKIFPRDWWSTMPTTWPRNACKSASGATKVTDRHISRP